MAKTKNTPPADDAANTPVDQTSQTPPAEPGNGSGSGQPPVEPIETGSGSGSGEGDTPPVEPGSGSGESQTPPAESGVGSGEGDKKSDGEAPKQATFNDQFIPLLDKFISDHVANGNPETFKDQRDKWLEENLPGYKTEI